MGWGNQKSKSYS